MIRWWKGAVILGLQPFLWAKILKGRQKCRFLSKKFNVEAFRYYLAFGSLLDFGIAINDGSHAFLFYECRTEGTGRIGENAMKFEDVIKNLYSNDDELICDTLNSGLHIDNCIISDDAVATGFCCKVHTGTVFDVLYLISQQTICYLKSCFCGRLPIGLIFKYNPDLRLWNDLHTSQTFHSGFFCPEEYRNRWCDSYDIESGKFNIVMVKDAKETQTKSIDSLILDNNKEVHSFIVFKGIIEKESYPFYSNYIPELFKSSKFSIKKIGSRGFYNKDSYSLPSYEKYNGIYDLDDDFVDDVLGGVPDAYWNID